MNFIPLAQPDISEADIDAVVGVLRSGMLVQGEQVERLESWAADFVGVDHAIAVANGTAALHLALVALGIGPGDEVIVPAFSSVATANVVELVGARCVFVDVGNDTWNLDADLLESAISEQTRAIIPVHEFGLPCAIDRIVDIAQAHGLAVIEDAACALGAGIKGRKAGAFGPIGCFSLHPRKAITSGEGGIVTTDDADLAARIRLLRTHGLETRDGVMVQVAAGFNYRLTDFQAAMVNGQALRMDAAIRHRAKLADHYRALLADAPWATLPRVPEGYQHSWQTFHILLDERIDRDQVIAALKDRGIGSNYGAQCIPAQLYYRQAYELSAQQLFPNAYRAYRSGLALPLHSKMGLEEADRVAATLGQVVESLA